MKKDESCTMITQVISTYNVHTRLAYFLRRGGQPVVILETRNCLSKKGIYTNTFLYTDTNWAVPVVYEVNPWGDHFNTLKLRPHSPAGVVDSEFGALWNIQTNHDSSFTEKNLCCFLIHFHRSRIKKIFILIYPAVICFLYSYVSDS